MSESQKGPRYTPQEAAELLGVSDQTIRNRIRDQRLPGYAETDERTGVTRYYVDAEAINNEAERRKAESEDIVRHYADEVTRQVSRTMREGQAANRNLFLQRIEQQEASNKAAFAAVVANQEKTIELLQEAVKLLRTLAEVGSGLWTLILFI